MIHSNKAAEKPKSIVRTVEKEDAQDLSLRPERLSDFIGQRSVKENLEICLEAAKKRNEALDHVLLYGGPGIGKTSLAHIIAKEMGASIKITSGPMLKKAGDLASILSSLKDTDILFIDEIHRLHKTVEETLYSAMEDYALDIILGKGPSAKTIRLDLPKFTLIGATTRISMIAAPMRTRFGHVYRLNHYELADLMRIITRSAHLLGADIEPNASKEIAMRCRKTPRIANRLLKRVRDFAEVKGNGSITEADAKEALNMLEIDNLGLDEVDRRLLTALIEKFSGGPTGLTTLAHATAEEKETIEDVYEPFLLQLGFIDRTPKGRIATPRAYEHLNLEHK